MFLANLMADVDAQDIVIGAGGLGLNSLASQIGRIVSDGSPPLRRFFRAVLRRR